MSLENGSVGFEEFLKPQEEIDVQKAVVESLAAEKVAQDETIEQLTSEKAALAEEKKTLEAKVASLEAKVAELEEKNRDLVGNGDSLAKKGAEFARKSVAFEKQNAALEKKVAALEEQVASQRSTLEKVGDVLATNTDNGLSSKVSLLDRCIELPDRFDGETRDHVLEVIAEARNRAEAEGRNRRAQVLEGVLAANEPGGELARRRAALEKLFNDNGNIVSGTVIEELKNLGISHKNGEEYLLPSEIIKRNY